MSLSHWTARIHVTLFYSLSCAYVIPFNHDIWSVKLFSLFSFSLYERLQNCVLVFSYHISITYKGYSRLAICLDWGCVSLEDVLYQVGNPRLHTIQHLNLKALRDEFHKNRSCPGKSIWLRCNKSGISTICFQRHASDSYFHYLYAQLHILSIHNYMVSGYHELSSVRIRDVRQSTAPYIYSIGKKCTFVSRPR